MDILTYNLDQLERWFLMLFRISSLMIVLPFYGYTSIPVIVRMATSVILTSFLFPLHPEMQIVVGTGVISFFGVVLREVGIGLAIGMSATLLFYGVQFGGHVIGHTMGFAIINIMDPQSQQQVPLMGQLLNLLAIMIFLTFNGHHFLLMVISETFVRIPIGTGMMSGLGVEAFARLGADIFVTGVKIGSPVLVSILVAEFALGFLARTVPQMNVWIIGFPLKIGLGLLTLGLSLPMFIYVFSKVYSNWQGDIIDFITIMMTG